MYYAPEIRVSLCIYLSTYLPTHLRVCVHLCIANVPALMRYAMTCQQGRVKSLALSRKITDIPLRNQLKYDRLRPG